MSERPAWMLPSSAAYRIISISLLRSSQGEERATMRARSPERTEREPSTGRAGEPVGGRFSNSGIGSISDASILARPDCCVKAPPLGAMSRLFGEKLRHLRRQQGMTQLDLAHRLALASHGHITNLETSRDVPSLDLVLRVARLFGVATDYLLRSAIPVEEVVTSAVELTANTMVLPHHFGKKLRTLRLQHALT